MPHKIKVLSFDLDDTLWPCYPTILNAEKMLYQWLETNVPEITRRYNIDELRDKRQSLKTTHQEFVHDLTALRLLSFKQLQDEFNLGGDWIQPAFNVFHDARQQVTLYDDVRPVLDELKKEFQLVSLTNGNADIVKTGVDHWFDLALNSITVGRQKSEPEIYLQVQHLTKISASQMVHIGDDPLQDIYGAKRAGVLAVWLNREQNEWQCEDCRPDAEISSLHELPAVLKQWQNNRLTK